jgi:hypothetical protein
MSRAPWTKGLSPRRITVTLNHAAESGEHAHEKMTRTVPRPLQRDDSFHAQYRPATPRGQNADPPVRIRPHGIFWNSSWAWLIDLVVALSTMAFVLAAFNAATRMLFAMVVGLPVAITQGGFLSFATSERCPTCP